MEWSLCKHANLCISQHKQQPDCCSDIVHAHLCLHAILYNTFPCLFPNCCCCQCSTACRYSDAAQQYSYAAQSLSPTTCLKSMLTYLQNESVLCTMPKQLWCCSGRAQPPNPPKPHLDICDDDLQVIPSTCETPITSQDVIITRTKDTCITKRKQSNLR